jgi:hypothetical protein
MPDGNQLVAGQALERERPLWSTNRVFFLIPQEDGDLVLYRQQTDGSQRPLWSTKTAGKGGCKCAMQGDGNFALYDVDEALLWSTNTSGNPGGRVVVQDDGNLVVLRKDGAPLWSSKTKQVVSDEVVAFKDKGYGGDWTRVSPMSNLPNVPVPSLSWNDALSSMFVPSGLKVTLYKHADLRGPGMILYEDTPWLGSSVNDQVTSIRIEPGVRPKDRALICTEKGFLGWNLELPVGRHDLQTLGFGDEKIASLRVPAGLKVTLWEHPGFTGRSRTCYESVASLGSIHEQTSSIVVEPGDAPADRVTIFMDRAFGGWSKELPEGRYDAADLGIGDDTLSSLRVPPGLRATLHENADFTGRTQIYYSDSEHVGAAVDNKISSISVEAGELPTDRVTVFDEPGYQGWCQEFGVGEYDVAALAIGDETISSIRVPPGLCVQLYERAGFQGRSVTCYESAYTLGQSADDVTSSLRVRAGWPPTDEVIVYSDANFLGWTHVLGAGRTTRLEIGNDTLSSLRVPSGCRVTLFEHAQYTGRRMICYGDTRYVGDRVNDEVTSVSVEVGGPPDDRVTVYVDKNRQGWNQELGEGVYHTRDLTVGNNSVSSVRVPTGMQVELFDGDGASGRTITFATSMSYVWEFNDLTSSIRVSRLARGPKPTLAEVQALIRRFGPRIYFHPSEPYLPSSIEWFRSRATCCGKDRSRKPATEPLPAGGDDDGAYWLELPDTARGGDLTSAATYINVIHGDYTFDVQFWLFYPYNGPGSLRVNTKSVSLKPMGIHTGDWEHFTLRFRAHDRKLLAVYLSQHDTGRWVDPSALEQEDGHPVVYASLHGHATFHTRGETLMHTFRLKEPMFGATLATFGLSNMTDRSGNYLDTWDLDRAVMIGSTAFDVARTGSMDYMDYKRRWGPHRALDLRRFENMIMGGICLLVPAACLVAEVALRPLARKLLDGGVPKDGKEQNGPTGPWAKRSWSGDDY